MLPFRRICDATHFLWVVGQDLMTLPWTKLQHHPQSVHHRMRQTASRQIVCSVTHTLLVIGQDNAFQKNVQCHSLSIHDRTTDVMKLLGQISVLTFCQIWVKSDENFSAEMCLLPIKKEQYHARTANKQKDRITDLLL